MTSSHPGHRSTASLQRHRSFFTVDDVDPTELETLIDTVTPADAYPNADAIENEVVVYDMAIMRTPEERRAVIEELAHVFSDGPGVVVMRNAVDVEVVDRATAEFTKIIEAEKAAGAAKGDHFAAPGANERVWNALEKLAVAAPEVFVDYYAFDALEIASTAWLGPAYQVTSQLNVVNPGGVAQSPHRDYHLGFMTDDQAERYPTHAHLLSPALTLQGAVAHVGHAAARAHGHSGQRQHQARGQGRQVEGQAQGHAGLEPEGFQLLGRLGAGKLAVKMRGDNVVQRVLDRRRRGVAVRHGTEQ